MARSERDDDYKGDEKKNVSKWSFIIGKWVSSVLVDFRQIIAGFLTLTMFLMLAYMIKKDHFSSHSPVATSSKFGENTAVIWRDDSPVLKPCWTKPTLEEGDQSEGYVTFSLTDGPEYHIAQIADAVVVARSLGATLVLPDIRGSKLGDKREFEDVYDAQNFINSLDGVIRVVKEPPSKISLKKLAVVKVPNRVTKDHIAEKIEPVFRAKGNIRLATYFPSVNMKKPETKGDLDSVACMAIFGSLDVQPEIGEVVDSVVKRLRTLSKKSDGRFVAVDLRIDVLEKKGCKDKGGLGKSCYDAGEIATFLRKLGFGKDTTIYLTQSIWDSSLDALKELFPKTYTKEGILPMDKKEQFLNSVVPNLEKIIDFYICLESDVFVPAIFGLFYANVAGKRISSGKTQILVPSNIPGSSASLQNYISHYVTKKNHLAYSCLC